MLVVARNWDASGLADVVRRGTLTSRQLATSRSKKLTHQYYRHATDDLGGPARSFLLLAKRGLNSVLSANPVRLGRVGVPGRIDEYPQWFQLPYGKPRSRQRCFFHRQVDDPGGQPSFRKPCRRQRCICHRQIDDPGGKIGRNTGCVSDTFIKNTPSILR